MTTTSTDRAAEHRGLGELNLMQAAAAVRAREVSPVELTEHYLARIEATEPLVHAYTTVSADVARSSARAAEQAVLDGEPLGPLHGVPVGVKDIFDTAGVRTTYGSPLFEQHVPTRDADAVARLRQAGAVVLGKHATHEFAWGGRTDSAHFGPTHNPQRRGHIPGGSSGGSGASVAVGSSLGAIGTDTAGSVRIPAALSGCVGFKPSRGRVSVRGARALAPSLDHVGAMARTVADVQALVDAVSDRPVGPVASAAVDVADLRLATLSGWPTDLLAPEVRHLWGTFRASLSASGVQADDVALTGEGPTEAILTRILAEAGAHYRPMFAEDPDSFGADLAALLALPAPDAPTLASAEAAIAHAVSDLLDALTRCHAVLLPTVPVTAPAIGAMHLAFDGRTDIPVEFVLTRLTSIANAAGLPALSVPVGVADGLPVGVQVVGRPGDDVTAVAVAAAVEQLCGKEGVQG